MALGLVGRFLYLFTKMSSPPVQLHQGEFRYKFNVKEVTIVAGVDRRAICCSGPNMAHSKLV